MKKLFLLTIASICIFAHEPKFANVKSSLIFVSPQRSGTHLTNLVLQLFTRRPYYRYQDGKFQNIQHCDIKPNLKKRPYFHTHYAAKLKSIDQKTNQLLLLMRNPKELVVRYTKGRLLKNQVNCTKEILEDKLVDIESYRIPLDLLEAFDQWPKDKRLLITYEGLLINPQSTIKRILAFLGESQNNMNKLLPIFEKCKRVMIENYEKNFAIFGGSMSKGTSSSFHTRDISKNVLIQADQLLKQTHPDLWEKYLTRYTTK